MTAVDERPGAPVAPEPRENGAAVRVGGPAAGRAARRAGRRGAGTTGKALLHVLFIGAILVAWQYESSSGRFDPLLVPQPTDIVTRIWQPHNSGTIWYNGLPTLQALLVGFAIGAVAAFVLAVVFTEIPALGGFFENYIHAIGAIPFMVLAPLLLIWFAQAIQASIFVVALTAFAALFANVYTGLSGTDPRLLELGRILGANRVQRLVKLRWWASLPYLFSGLKAALPRAVFSAVVIEFLGSSRGLGYLMVSDGNNLATASLFADVIVLIVVIRVLLVAIRVAERRVLSWRPKEQS
jgi:NitT/TauT family transport system permease protein